MDKILPALGVIAFICCVVFCVLFCITKNEIFFFLGMTFIPITYALCMANILYILFTDEI